MAVAVSLGLCASAAGAAAQGSKQAIDLTRAAPTDGVDAWSQTAASGSLTGSGDEMVLRLEHTSDSVVGLSDHPSRVVGKAGAKAFFGAWDDRFGVDPPNAVLTYTKAGSETPSTTALTLSKTTYEPAADAATYEVEPPANYDAAGTTAKLPKLSSFTHASLLIDDAEGRPSSANSAITLVNAIPAEAARVVEFRVYQGEISIARLGVEPGRSTDVPTTNDYTAQAFTKMGNFRLSSNTVSFDATSLTLLAQVKVEAGYTDFQLVSGPGSQPDAITCENTTSESVTFRLQRPNSPFAVVVAVDAHDTAYISTQRKWTVFSVVNGFQTPTVTVTDPNAKLTAIQNGSDFALITS